MSIAVWTDSNGKVERLHYQPADVDTSGADVVDTPVPDSTTEDWVQDSLYYNSTDGFYHQSEDPFAGLNFTDAEKQDVYDAVQDNDLVKVRNIVENALNS